LLLRSRKKLTLNFRLTVARRRSAGDLARRRGASRRIRTKLEDVAFERAPDLHCTVSLGAAKASAQMDVDAGGGRRRAPSGQAGRAQPLRGRGADRRYKLIRRLALAARTASDARTTEQLSLGNAKSFATGQAPATNDLLVRASGRQPRRPLA